MSVSVSQSNESGSARQGYIVPSHGRGALKPFKKGETGNPGGNQGEYQRVRRLCADHCEEAALGMIRLMRESEDERIQFMCMTAIMERGIGKPRDHSADEQARGFFNLDVFTDEERALLAKLLMRAAQKDAP